MVLVLMLGIGGGALGLADAARGGSGPRSATVSRSSPTETHDSEHAKRQEFGGLIEWDPAYKFPTVSIEKSGLSPLYQAMLTTQRLRGLLTVLSEDPSQEEVMAIIAAQHYFREGVYFSDLQINIYASVYAVDTSAAPLGWTAKMESDGKWKVTFYFEYVGLAVPSWYYYDPTTGAVTDG
jgi:hypothetical protein